MEPILMVAACVLFFAGAKFVKEKWLNNAKGALIAELAKVVLFALLFRHLLPTSLLKPTFEGGLVLVLLGYFVVNGITAYRKAQSGVKA